MLSALSLSSSSPVLPSNSELLPPAVSLQCPELPPGGHLKALTLASLCALFFLAKHPKFQCRQGQKEAEMSPPSTRPTPTLPTRSHPYSCLLGMAQHIFQGFGNYMMENVPRNLCLYPRILKDSSDPLRVLGTSPKNTCNLSPCHLTIVTSAILYAKEENNPFFNYIKGFSYR